MDPVAFMQQTGQTGAMALTRTWIPYLWAIPLGVLAWYATHDEMVRYMGLPEANLWTIFFLILVGYSIALVACHRKPITAHQLGHLVVFEATTFLGFQGSNLQCVAGIMYMFMVAGTACVVVLAGVVLALTRLVVRPRRAANGPG